MTINKHLFILLISLFGCLPKHETQVYSGYIEAEYIYITASDSGWITEQNLTIGESFASGDVLTKLDDNYQQINIEEQQAKLAQATAQLQNLKIGVRPEEIKVFTLQREEKLINKKLAQIEYERLLLLNKQNLSTDAEIDKAKYRLEALEAEIKTLSAQINVEKLPAREHLITNAEQAVNVAQSELKKAIWQWQQRTLIANNQGVVDQLFFRQGEFVNKGQVILSALIPSSKKVRFYLDQAALHQVQLGKVVNVCSDGSALTYKAQITYIAKHAEFTPPVIYSKTTRNSLVFLVEASFSEEVTLNKGQPVDVTFND